MIGASGAIAGLLGVFVVRFYKNKISIAYFFIFLLFYIRWGVVEITSLAALSLWIGRELISGLLQISGAASQVANWAHIGGFVFGVVVALVFRFSQDASAEYLSDEAAKWAKMGMHAGAASRYQEILGNDPKSTDVFRQLARSMLFSETAEKERVIENYKKAIELYCKDQKRQEALEIYQELAEAYSEAVLDPKAQFAMSSLSEGHSQFQLAADAYRRLIDAYPTSGEAEKVLFWLAHVYLRMGMLPEAREI